MYVRPTSDELYPDNNLRKIKIRTACSRYKVGLITLLSRYTWSPALEGYVEWDISTSLFERSGSSVRQRDEKIYEKDEI